MLVKRENIETSRHLSSGRGELLAYLLANSRRCDMKCDDNTHNLLYEQITSCTYSHVYLSPWYISLKIAPQYFHVELFTLICIVFSFKLFLEYCYLTELILFYCLYNIRHTMLVIFVLWLKQSRAVTLSFPIQVFQFQNTADRLAVFWWA